MLHQCRGTKVGVDVWIYSSFSELKLPALSSWGIFEGENKCFDKGTILLQGGEDITYSMVTRSRHTISKRFPSSLVSPVVLGLFLLLGKLPCLPGWKLKEFSPSCTSSLQYSPDLWDSCLAKPMQSLNRSRDWVELLFVNMVLKTLSSVE